MFNMRDFATIQVLVLVLFVDTSTADCQTFLDGYAHETQPTCPISHPAEPRTCPPNPSTWCNDGTIGVFLDPDPSLSNVLGTLMTENGAGCLQDYSTWYSNCYTNVVCRPAALFVEWPGQVMRECEYHDVRGEVLETIRDFIVDLLCLHSGDRVESERARALLGLGDSDVDCVVDGLVGYCLEQHGHEVIYHCGAYNDLDFEILLASIRSHCTGGDVQSIVYWTENVCE